MLPIFPAWLIRILAPKLFDCSASAASGWRLNWLLSSRFSPSEGGLTARELAIWRQRLAELDGRIARYDDAHAAK